MRINSKKVIVAVGVFLQVVMLGNSVFAARLMRKGMSGQDVSTLQSNLASLGHYNYRVTGYFGDITQRAVKDFQRKHGLAADGVVGRATMNSIQQSLGSAPSAPGDAVYCRKSWF